MPTLRRFLPTAAALLMLPGLLDAQATRTRPATEPAAIEPPALVPWAASSEQTVRLGQLDPASGYKFQLVISNRGAGIASLKLSDYYETDEDKRRAEESEDHAEYLKTVEQSPAYRGHYRLLGPVKGENRLDLPYQTGVMTVTFEDGRTMQYSLRDALWTWAPGARTQSAESENFTMHWQLRRLADPDAETASERYAPLLTVRKTWTVTKGSYSAGLTLAFENHTDQRMAVSISQYGAAGVPQENYRDQDLRRVAYGYWVTESKRAQPQLKGPGALQEMNLYEPVTYGTSNHANPMLWIGHVNKYFGSMMYLTPTTDEDVVANTYRAGFFTAAAMDGPVERTWLTGISLPQVSLEPAGKTGSSRRVAFDVFAGPKKQSLFKSVTLYDQLNYIGTIDLSGCFCASDTLALGMMWLLGKLSWLAIGNYGVAIIFLVVLVRMALHPLTKRGQINMHRMQRLAPEMSKLKEKYKDDKETLNREMMRLYKEGGSNPLLGCLPMLLQMPIWIALYTALRVSVELRHAAFLPVWLTDLARPDALVSFGADYWLIGESFNLLPLLVCVAMFLQMKFNPSMAAQRTAATPEQQQQQKLMKYMMPGIMLFIFYKMPSGLNLYIMTSTFAGVAEQHVIRKHIAEREEADGETVVSAPGKQPRGKRPKKPKGPFHIKQG